MSTVLKGLSTLRVMSTVLKGLSALCNISYGFTDLLFIKDAGNFKLRSFNIWCRQPFESTLGIFQSHGHKLSQL